MPHCEIHYSDDLRIDAEATLALVEAVINSHDENAQECKGRAYPAAKFHRTHIQITVSLLSKPHRDEVFTKALMIDLENQIKRTLSQSCFFSLQIEYSSPYYETNLHQVEGDELPGFRS